MVYILMRCGFATLDIISREEIPDDIFILEDDKFLIIHKFTFDNGLVYYIGFNRIVNNLNHILLLLKDDYENYSSFKKEEDMQKFFIDNFEFELEIEECNKIIEYYRKNKDLIEQVINFNYKL